MQDRNLSAKRKDFIKLAASLDAMSPLRVLSRGYSLTEDELGNTVKRASQLREGERIKLRFAQGSADCRVEKINKGE